jgi:glutamate formiminotransferase / 5-formyltetrahydrofolate cyclo-ligase
VLECVINVSEGRRGAVLDALTHAADGALLDLHRDPHHNRAVLTLASAHVEAAARAVAREAVARIDLREHEGVHPRIGAVDVVPFVPLPGSSLADALAARNAFAAWAGEELGLPCFYYGPERTLPEVRRRAFESLAPNAGPARPHATAGGCAVGAREVLVAYNVWLAPSADLPTAQQIARAVRAPAVRALALQVGERIQVSMNLLAPHEVGPAEVFDHVASLAAVDGAELVGLMPAAALDAVPRDRWRELGLDASATIEARLQEAGLDGGRFGSG